MTLIFLVALLVTGGTPAQDNSGSRDTPPNAKPEKVRCVRQVETGSMARVTKTCRTLREWQAIRDSTRDEWRNQVRSGAPGSSGG